MKTCSAHKSMTYEIKQIKWLIGLVFTAIVGTQGIEKVIGCPLWLDETLLVGLPIALVLSGFIILRWRLK